MRPRRSSIADERIELNFTPMIDVMFQLFIFFMVTFRIAGEEGQFGINMPRGPITNQAAAKGGNDQAPLADPVPASDEALDLTADVPVHLVSTAHGRLAEIRYGAQSLGTRMENLTAQLKSGAIQAMGHEADIIQVTLNADDNLRYESIMQAINAITRAGIKKIKFSPPGTPAPPPQSE